MNDASLCRLCLSSDTQLYCRKESVDVYRCRGCGLIYVNHIHTYPEIKEHYSKEYFKPYLKTERIHFKKRFKRRIREIKKLKFAGELLDVGSGAGFFLNLASNEGYRVKGVELSKWACQYAKDNFSLDIFCGELKDAPFKEASFDIITLWHILEHTTDPKEFLIQVNRLLRPGGILAIEVPNIGSNVAKVCGQNWELLAPREHLFYFNQDTLNGLLRDAGFGILRTQSYLWTTPAMVFKSMAGLTIGFKRFILRIVSLFLSVFSVFRFITLPNFIEGDVVTIYATKKEIDERSSGL